MSDWVWFLLLPCTALAAGLAGRFWPRVPSGMGRMRAIKKVHTDELREGQQARLLGKIEMRSGLLWAPLSNRPCVAYQITIKQGRSFHQMAATLSESEVVDFWLCDDRGRVLIDAEAYSADLGVTAVEVVESQARPSERLARYLDEHSLKSRGPRTLCEERSIGVGYRIIAAGLVRRGGEQHAGVSGNYREDAGELVLGDFEDGPLLLLQPSWTRR